MKKNEKIKKKDARREIERDVGRIDWTFLQASKLLYYYINNNVIIIIIIIIEIIQ